MPRTENSIANQLKSNGTVRDYYIFTNIRYVLKSYQTPPSFDKNTADPTKFYFAVKDFDMQASCYCNGMSDECNSTSFAKCNCQKNTAGDNCESCKPLFNNKPWQYGIACEKCNCSDLASSCIYSPSRGHGVCQGCIRNTTGDFCQQCLPGYHRNSNSLCISCGCNLSGVNQAICNESTGVCFCKQNVEGVSCDTCKNEFFNLTIDHAAGCRDCSCRVALTTNGSNICDKTTGQCPCVRGFSGRTCNVCSNGFYSSQLINPNECRECLCSPQGSLNISCSQNGNCYCRPYFSGQKCEVLASSYFTSSIAQSLYSAAKAVAVSSVSAS